MLLPSIKDADVSNKTVFLRGDLDVPLAGKKIEDDTRLLSGLDTLTYLLENNARVLIAGHMGRPEGVDHAYSLEPLISWYQQHIPNSSPSTYEQRGEFWGWKIHEKVFLLENLRFYEGEVKHDPAFSKRLALLADIYVDDAFGVAHRNNASIVGIPQFLPHFAGIHLLREIDVLSGLLENPKRPLVVIIGGAKVETKLPLVEKMHAFADFVLVGGKLPQEGDALSHMKDEKLVLATLTEDGFDIAKESVEAFLPFIAKAGTIIWNGPLGKVNGTSEEGSQQIATAVAQSAAYKVVGGGDTLDFLRKIGLLSKFDFCSTGGGAMLAFLSGEKLPGLEALI